MEYYIRGSSMEEKFGEHWPGLWSVYGYNSLNSWDSYMKEVCSDSSGFPLRPIIHSHSTIYVVLYDFLLHHQCAQNYRSNRITITVNQNTLTLIHFTVYSFFHPRHTSFCLRLHTQFFFHPPSLSYFRISSYPAPVSEVHLYCAW